MIVLDHSVKLSSFTCSPPGSSRIILVTPANADANASNFLVTSEMQSRVPLYLLLEY